MYSNRILALLTAVLMLLAGCTGGADAAPVADADDTDTPTDDGGSADTSASSDSDDLELSDPGRLLCDVGSFTISWSHTGVEAAVTCESAADFDAERLYSRTTSTIDRQSDAGSVEQYAAGDAAYVRVGGGDEAMYTSHEGSTEVLAAAIMLLQTRAYGAGDDLTFAGTEMFDGASVERYELSVANEVLILIGSAAA